MAHAFFAPSVVSGQKNFRIAAGFPIALQFLAQFPKIIDFPIENQPMPAIRERLIGSRIKIKNRQTPMPQSDARAGRVFRTDPYPFAVRTAMGDAFRHSPQRMLADGTSMIERDYAGESAHAIPCQSSRVTAADADKPSAIAGKMPFFT